MTIEEQRKLTLQYPKVQELSILGQMSGDHSRRVHEMKSEAQRRVLTKVQSMALSNASEREERKQKLQANQGHLDLTNEQHRNLVKRAMQTENLRYLQNQIRERSAHKEYLKAANLSYERSMLDLSVKQGAGGAQGPQQQKGKKTKFDKPKEGPKYPRMKKKVADKEGGPRMKNQQSRKPFY